MTKLNDIQARAYIAGDCSDELNEIERKHILYLIRSLQEALNRPGMNLSNLLKTADHYIKNHAHTINTKELYALITMRDNIKDRAL